MSATITGKLNKAAHQFQAGESTGFAINIGEQYYDRTTKSKEWTNYKAVIFAKIPQQIQYLTDVLVQGSIISLTCKQLKIDVYEGQNGQSLTIEMIDASLQNAYSPSQPQQTKHVPENYSPPPQQAAPQQVQQQAPQGTDNWSDEIQF